MPVLFLFLLVLLSAKVQADCDAEKFLDRVCVSGHSQPLTARAMADLICEERKLHASIYRHLQEAFYIAPAWFQKQLCSIEKLGIYPLSGSSAAAWSFPNRNQIGLLKDKFDQGFGLEVQAKILLNQAIGRKKLMSDAILPSSFGYQTSGPFDIGAGFLYLIAHEVGHLVYYQARSTGRLANECAELLAMDMWTPESELQSFVLSDALVHPQNLNRFFKRLHQSGSVTAFGLRTAEEGFCELFSHLVLAESKAPALTFTDLSGYVVNIWERIRTEEKLSQKIRVLRQLLNL